MKAWVRWQESVRENPVIVLPVVGTFLVVLPFVITFLVYYLANPRPTGPDLRWWLSAVVGVQCYVAALILLKRKPVWTGAERNAFFASLVLLGFSLTYGVGMAALFMDGNR